ncbi:hypothetical protein VPH35_075599 [Triticum aestivum]
MARYFDDEKPPTSDAENNVGIGLVRMKRPAYGKKEVALTADSVAVMVELNATSSAMAREGLDLVVVLDIQLSWEGGDVKFSKVKEAIEFLIMKLTPMDRLSMVFGKDTAGVERRLCPLRCMTRAGQADLKDLISASGQDNLSLNLEKGLTEALAVIRSRIHTEGRSANIIFLTDDREGTGDALSVDPGNVAVHTFGFGKNAGIELLADMARKSPGGTFSWVPDESNLIPPFARLLGGLLTIVAQDVQLTLTSRKKDVVKMVMPNGISRNYWKSTAANSRGEKEIIIFFGAIFSGEARKVLVNFQLKPSKNNQKFNATIAEAQLSYNAQQGLQTQTPRNIIMTRAPEPTGSPSVDSAILHAEEVRQQVVLAVRGVSELAQKHRLEEARYELNDAKKAVEKIMLNDGQNMVSVLRAELLQLIKLTQSMELYKEQGRPYVLGTETSHSAQRAAGHGDTVAVSLYDTPRMITYLQQAKQIENDPKALVPSADEDVKHEIAANPLAAFAGPLDIYLENAMKALQAIQNIVHSHTNNT